MPEQAARRERNLPAADAGPPRALTGGSDPIEAPPRSPGSSRHGAERRAATPSGGRPERRTVVIRGQVADRGGYRARPVRASAYSRMRPERAALYAVLLGLALVVAALASAHI